MENAREQRGKEGISRKEFLQLVGALAASTLPVATACRQPAAERKLRRGVSFYSYQALFFTGQMSLEDMVAEAASIGAVYLEMLPDQNIPEFPRISDQFVKQWHDLMNKYHTIPDAYCQHQDIFGAERLFWDIGQAARLGFRFIRLMAYTPMDIVERCLPAAEKADITLVYEIHGPNRLDGPQVEGWAKMMDRLGSRHLGLNPDFSLWEKKASPVKRDVQIRAGVLRADIAKYIDQACDNAVPEDKAVAEVEKMGGGEREKAYLTSRYSGYQDPQKLLPLKPYVRRFHGKIYDMTEDFTETSIPYEEIVPFLIQNGFEGTIVTENERTRNIMDAFPVDEIEQVRRHQVQLMRLLGE